MGKASRDKRDIYYRKAKEEGWRARSAFKLLQIDEEFNIFEGVKRVVDLCAAPGSWSQVLSRKLYLPAKFSPEPSQWLQLKVLFKCRVTSRMLEQLMWSSNILMDVKLIWLSAMVLLMVWKKTLNIIILDSFLSLFVCLFYLFLSLLFVIMMVAVTGLHDMDEFVQSQLILAGLTIVTHILRDGGKFIAKIFRGKDTSLLYCQLKLFFPVVTFAKPKSSRNSSIEAFAVCENYSPPEGFSPKDLHHLLEKVGTPSGSDDYDCSSGWLEGPNKVYIPFLACGDLSGYDSDRSYPLPDVAEGASYQSLDPVQPPIAPPYKRALELKKASSQGIRDLEKLSLDS